MGTRQDHLHFDHRLQCLISYLHANCLISCLSDSIMDPPSRMFLVKQRTWQCCQMDDALMEDPTICSLDPFLTIGSICLKSPPNTTAFPLKGFVRFSLCCIDIMSRNTRSNASKQNLLNIGASSHMINLASRRNFALGLPWLMLHVESSWI